MKGVTYNTTKELLIQTPLPLQTNTYMPVAHERLMDLTLEGIHQAGFNLDRELYSSSNFGQVAHGRFTINTVSDTEMDLQIMWQNSYDKSLKLTFSIGAMVLVCTNGMVSFRSIDSFRKKHVGDIQTLAPQRIAEYIKNAADTFKELQGEREAMKQVEVNRRIIAELIGRMYIEEQFIESTQLNIIKRELDKPTHNYKADGSLWELYNYTTFAIGGVNPSRWMEDHMKAHKFFSEACTLLTKPAELITTEAEVIGTKLLSMRGIEEPTDDPRVKQLRLYE